MDFEMIGGTHDMLHNEILQKMIHKNLSYVGGYKYDKEELVFAKEISKSMNTELDIKYVEAVSYTHLTLPTICSL